MNNLFYFNFFYFHAGCVFGCWPFFTSFHNRHLFLYLFRCIILFLFSIPMGNIMVISKNNGIIKTKQKTIWTDSLKFRMTLQEHSAMPRNMTMVKSVRKVPLPAYGSWKWDKKLGFLFEPYVFRHPVVGEKISGQGVQQPFWTFLLKFDFCQFLRRSAAGYAETRNATKKLHLPRDALKIAGKLGLKPQ